MCSIMILFHKLWSFHSFVEHTAVIVIDTVGKTTVFENFRKRNMEKDKKKEERREKREERRENDTELELYRFLELSTGDNND